MKNPNYIKLAHDMHLESNQNEITIYENCESLIVISRKLLSEVFFYEKNLQEIIEESKKAEMEKIRDEMNLLRSLTA